MQLLFQAPDERQCLVLSPINTGVKARNGYWPCGTLADQISARTTDQSCEKIGVRVALSGGASAHARRRSGRAVGLYRLKTAICLMRRDSNVGAGLPANAVNQSLNTVTDTPH